MRQLLSMASLLALVLAQTLPARAQDGQDPGTPKKETIQAFSLKVTGDGHVDLKVQEKDGEKSYTADSMEEFRRKYPDVARATKLDGMLHPDFHEFAKPFEEWKRHFGELTPELEKLLQNPEHLFGKRLPAQPGPDVEGDPVLPPRRLGVRLAPLSETLADQLGLATGKGVQIVDVEGGSAAEKAGLKKNDVLLKVDGQEANQVEGARKAVLEALKKKEFSVDLVRQGKQQTLTVTSPVANE